MSNHNCLRICTPMALAVLLCLGVRVAVPSDAHRNLRCGPLSLEICIAICSRPIDPKRIDSLIEIRKDGCSLADLSRAAQRLGFSNIAVHWKGRLPPAAAAPAVIPIINRRGQSHFVAWVGCSDTESLIVDLPQDPVWISADRLRNEFRWTGEAMHIAADEAALAPIRAQIASSRSLDAAFWCGVAAAAIAVLYIARRPAKWPTTSIAR